MTFGISSNQPIIRAEKTQLSEQVTDVKEKQQTSENADAVQKAADKKESEVLNSKLTPENFKEAMEKEFGDSFDKITNTSLIEKRFSEMLMSLSDEDKSAKLSFILSEFQDKPSLVKVFFESFKDKEKAKACADRIEYNDYKNLNKEVQSVIVKHMSVPGTHKLFNEYKDEVYTFYHTHQEVIDKIYKNNLSEEERQKLVDNLSEDEKLIINQYCELVQIGVQFTQCALQNNNFSTEDTENLINEANDFFEELPSYNVFLEGIAKVLSDDSVNLNIDKNKLTEMLNNKSENKFSETVQKMAEKTAIDKETGFLKTADAEIVAKSQEKIQEIKNSITEPLEQQPVITKEAPVIAQNQDVVINYETLTGSGNTSRLKDVFTGKIKVSEFLEQAAIKQYKLMDTAMQGNILLDSSGKFFNDLVANTKTSTLENLLSIGWKGRSFDATQKVKEETEERKDDVA